MRVVWCEVCLRMCLEYLYFFFLFFMFPYFIRRCKNNAEISLQISFPHLVYPFLSLFLFFIAIVKITIKVSCWGKINCSFSLSINCVNCSPLHSHPVPARREILRLLQRERVKMRLGRRESKKEEKLSPRI